MIILIGVESSSQSPTPVNDINIRNRKSMLPHNKAKCDRPVVNTILKKGETGPFSP